MIYCSYVLVKVQVKLRGQEKVVRLSVNSITVRTESVHILMIYKGVIPMERRINGHTKLYALIGSPVGHSGSPAMQNYSFEKLGIDAAYLAFDVTVEQTAKALEAFRTLNAGGFNVTMPCKTEVARLVDRLSPAAELIGACNTVVVEEDGTMTGHITDGVGFVRNLKEH